MSLPAYINTLSPATAEALFEWVLDASPGSHIIYHVGFLARCFPASGAMMAVSNRKTCELAHAAYAYACTHETPTNFLELKQRKVGPGQWEYIATRTKRPFTIPPRANRST